jgi:DNA-binding MarR family transcriptional regulator
MSPARSTERLAVGQLLVHHLRLFRERLLSEAQEHADAAGVALRMSHLHVFGNIKEEGTRVSDLAAWAGMTAPSMTELVDELEGHELVERLPDPTDGRAKLVVLTASGWEAIRNGRAIIARIEADYASRIGSERFETMCWSLQELLDDLRAKRPEQ